jgi:glucose-1-phosphate thymidylyltransferase
MDGPTLVVPAAGLGSRLSPLCGLLPKCLLPVGDLPILHYVLDVGLKAPVKQIVIIVNSAGGKIATTVGRYYKGVPVHYVLQSSPLGLAHAVTLAEPYVDDAMIVINGDEIFLESHHKEAWESFVETSADALVCYVQTDDCSRITIGYGMELDCDGRVRELEEKPPNPRNNLLGVGTWLLRRNWFDCYQPTAPSARRGERDFVAVIQTMLSSGKIIRGFDLGGQFFNINTAADFTKVCQAIEALRFYTTLNGGQSSVVPSGIVN